MPKRIEIENVTLHYTNKVIIFLNHLLVSSYSWPLFIFSIL